MVAIIQLGITVGAVVGGLAFDSLGPTVTFLGSASILVLASVAAFAANKMHTRLQNAATQSGSMNDPLLKGFAP
jgi:predicted MFS family arabinose efflux permease